VHPAHGSERECILVVRSALSWSCDERTPLCAIRTRNKVTIYSLSLSIVVNGGKQDSLPEGEIWFIKHIILWSPK